MVLIADVDDKSAQMAAGDLPLVVLLGEDRGDEPRDRNPVGEDAHDVGAPPYLLLRRSCGLFDQEPWPGCATGLRWPKPASVLVVTSASISTQSPSHSKSRSASGISSRNSSNTSILSLAIAATSFIFGADEGDEVALVLPTLLVSYTTSWNTILYHMGSLARETLAECVLCWWHRSIRHYDV